MQKTTWNANADGAIYIPTTCLIHKTQIRVVILHRFTFQEGKYTQFWDTLIHITKYYKIV